MTRGIIIKEHERIDGIATHRLGAARARDMATITGRKTETGKRMGVSELTDRSSPDKTAAWRRRTHKLNHPVPGQYDLPLRPMPGFIFARQEEAYQEVKRLGIAIPEIADTHRGQGRMCRYTVLAAHRCPPEAIGEEVLGTTSTGLDILNACSGACELPVGTVVLAATYAGESMQALLGERAVALRCQLVAAVEEDLTGPDL